jgi:hypothetical protein
MNRKETKMKRLVMAACMAAAAGLLAAESAPKRRLAAAAYVAPFTEIAQTAAALGAVFNQPLVPAMAMAALQQSLMKDLGPFDGSAPMYALVYLDAAKAGGGNPQDMAEGALLYPVSCGEAAFIAGNEGAVKDASGVIRFAKRKKSFKYARFTADGKFCAFAGSAATAARAAGDVAKALAWLKSPKPALARVHVDAAGADAMAALLERAYAEQDRQLKAAKLDAALAGGIAAVNAVQRRVQLRLLRSIGGVKVAVGFDDRGLAVWGGASFRAGAAPFVPAGAAVPARAFGEIPSGTGVALVQNVFAGMQGSEVGAQAEICVGFCECLRTMLRDSRDKDVAKYRRTLDELLAAAIEAYRSLDGTKVGPRDWSACSLAFDARKRPVLRVNSEMERVSPAAAASAGVFLDRAIAILERQWPSNGFIRKLGEGRYAFDWARLIDVAAREAAGSGGKDAAKDAARAKAAVAKVLGGTVTECSFRFGGKGGSMKLAAPGSSIAPAPEGEGVRRLLAAVPEADKDAMLCCLYMTPYALVRDVAMPVMLKFASAEEARQHGAVMAKLPPAAPGGALAAASWIRSDGALKFALRITADEIKTYGAAVGALAGMADDDDDE